MLRAWLRRISGLDELDTVYELIGSLQGHVGDLQKEVHELETVTKEQLKLLDTAELERMRASVLNALRAYRRSVTAQETAGDTNGRGARVDLPPLPTPGPRRNY